MSRQERRNDPVRRSLPRSLLVLSYLAVQLALPLRCLTGDPLDRPRDFTWSTLEDRDRCRGIYMATLQDGEVYDVDLRRLFRPPSRASRVFYRSLLPRFHRFLCEKLRSDEELQRLDGICLCSRDGAPTVSLIRDGADLCRAPDHGVVPP